jgi:4-amino-4-deoxy-L-arabinose transferase-like glycosyltransferase
LRNVIDRNRWFSLALLAGFLLRLLAMIGYPGGLWFAGDSYVYVGAALRPQPNLSKTTGYSLFLRLLLPFHSFTLVTLVQHLMGLAVAVMIYVLARRYGVGAGGRGGGWGATIATLPQLLDGYIIEDEHLIMAETVFTFCLMLATLLLLWTNRTRWWVALIAGLLVGYAIIDRTEGAVMLGVIPLFVLIRAGQTYGWRRLQTWLIAVLVGVGCLVPLAAYDTWFHHYSGTWSVTGTRSDGFYLWGRVSSFAECSQIHASADVMKVCPTDPVTKRSAPGNYIWHASVLRDPNAYINTIGGSVSSAGNSLLTKFDEAAIESQPLGYMKSVVKGVLMSFEWPRQNYPGAGTVYYYEFHLHYVTSTYNTLPPTDHVWIKGGTAYSDWLSYGHQDPGVVVKPVAALIAGYSRIFYTWGPLLFVIFLLGLGGVLTITRRPWRLRWRRRQGSMLPWVSAVVLLVIPVATADFDYRYLIPVIPFACLAAGLGFAPVRARQSAPGPGAAEETRPVGVV